MGPVRRAAMRELCKGTHKASATCMLDDDALLCYDVVCGMTSLIIGGKHTKSPFQKFFNPVMKTLSDVVSGSSPFI